MGFAGKLSLKATSCAVTNGFGFGIFFKKRFHATLCHKGFAEKNIALRCVIPSVDGGCGIGSVKTQMTSVLVLYVKLSKKR